MIVISSINQKFLKTFLELYGWQFDMEEIPALFANCYMLELLNYFIRINCKIKRLQYSLRQSTHLQSISKDW